VDCIYLVQDEDQRRVLVNMTMKSGVSNIIMGTGGREDGRKGGRRDGEICWLADYIFCTRQILEKKWEKNEAVHQLYTRTYFKKVYDSGRREVLYNILIGLGIPLNLVRLLKMCLKETHSGVRVGKYLSDLFPVKNG
jgi:hypothetical protein